MKTVNKELIDFLTEIRDTDYKAMPMYFREKADKLVKSINSEAQNETPSVNDNEAQKKDCNSCEHRWIPINDCCRCSYLNNYEYWKQSD